MAEKGLKKTTSGALAYVLGPITGIFFLVIDKDPFVKFHAMQSIVVFAAIFILQVFLGFTVIFLPIALFLNIVSFALWLILIYKAWQGDEWQVPVLGKVARDFLKKI
jgi:uncharacterized membrane protein